MAPLRLTLSSILHGIYPSVSLVYGNPRQIFFASPSKSMAWTCSKCTFINPPSQKSTCQICLSSSSSSSLSSLSTPSTSSTPSTAGWSCKACTFSNASDRTKCDMCSTKAPGSLFSSSNFKELNSIGSDEEFDSSVGSVFLPLQPCKRKKQETVDSSDDFRESGKFCDMKKAKTLTGDLDVKTSFSTLKILSYNVWFREDLELYERMKAIGNLIEQHSPDFICLQEVTPNIYGTIQQFKWWKDYRCSVSKEMANTRPYFCMLMSKFPIKSFNRKPFSNSIMGRELCLAEIEDHMGKELVVATSHLESPCPAPPKWDQMYSKERVAQAKEALTVLKCSPNVIFGGDMNWNDELDSHFPLPDGWVDAWLELRSGENGWTYDTKSNQMLSGNRPLQRRLDRFICNLHDFKINGIEMIGMDSIQGISYSKEKKVRKEVQKLVLPVLPSDHYGLLLTISSK